MTIAAAVQPVEAAVRWERKTEISSTYRSRNGAAIDLCRTSVRCYVKYDDDKDLYNEA
jgi:hypothetical protein